MNSQMLEIVRSNLELKTLDELLQSVPGVGPVLSATMPAATQPVRCIFWVKTGAFYGQEATLLSSLPELGGNSRGCISSLVGVAPLDHDSDHAR